MTSQERVWEPLTEWPGDPHFILEELEAMLDDPSLCDGQKANIRAVIIGMETGNYIQPVYRDGKIIDIPEEDVSEIDWQETCRLLANSCAYVLSDANIIWLKVAVMAGGPSIFIQVSDDTGSDYITLRHSDLITLQLPLCSLAQFIY